MLFSKKKAFQKSLTPSNSNVRSSGHSNPTDFAGASALSNSYTIQRGPSSDVSQSYTKQSIGMTELEGCSPSGRCKGHNCPKIHYHSDAPSQGQFAPSPEDDVFEGHHNVSRPPLPPKLHRLSQLIDPNELPMDESVMSPEGNLLAPEQWLVHPDRPKSIRERQEQIAARIRALSPKVSNSSIRTPEPAAGRKRSTSSFSKVRVPSRLSRSSMSRRSSSSSAPSIPSPTTMPRLTLKKSAKPTPKMELPKRKVPQGGRGIVAERETQELPLHEIVGNVASCRALEVKQPSLWKSCWKSCWACFWNTDEKGENEEEEEEEEEDEEE